MLKFKRKFRIQRVKVSFVAIFNNNDDDDDDDYDDDYDDDDDDS